MLDDIYKPLSRTGEVYYGLVSTKNAIEDFRIDLDPDFQRKNVWTDVQQTLFIGHLLEGGDVNPVIINKVNDGYVMLDGKQRVTACLRFLDGLGAKLSDGRVVYYGDFDQLDRRMCRTQVGLRYALVDLTRRESLEFYLKLNRSGTPHSAAELDFVQKLLDKELEVNYERT